LTKRWYPYN